MASLVHRAVVLGNPGAAFVSDISAGAPASTRGQDVHLSHLIGLPARLDSPLAWCGLQFQGERCYLCVLSDSDVAELRAAVTHFKGLELSGEAVSRGNFPLPTLGPKLDKASHDVHHGRGFCVIRGINPAQFSVEDVTLVFLGVQSYIADQRGRQDSKGNMLVHIIADKSSESRLEHHRHSNKSITFHNEEAGDVVGWLTRSTAASGGRCILASAYTIYNTLAATRPDLVRLLARSDWPFALPHFQCRPVLWYRDAKLIMNFGRAALLGSPSHPRPAHLPGVTARQREALDMVEAIAQATQVEIQTQPGDMHFINNLAVLHRREGFVDGTGRDQKRHLVRMRLRSSDLGWSVPPELGREWSEAFKENARRIYHVEPKPDGHFPLRYNPN